MGPKLSKEEKEALKSIENGADVYSYAIAGTLRKLQKTRPKLFDICDAMNPPSGEKQQPYFWAILTEEGKNALKGDSADSSHS